MSEPMRADLDWFVLLWRVCDGVAAPAECARLDEILRNDADARRQYLQYVALVSDLGSEGNAGPRLADDDAPASTAAGHSQVNSVLGFLYPTIASLSRFGFTPRVMVIAISSLLTGYFAIMLGMVVWDYTRRIDKMSESRQAVRRESGATVSAERDSRWTDTKPSQIGQTLAAGSLHLQQGAIEFTLDGGVRVVVEGPAEFEVVNSARVRLGRGRLLAQVPKAAAGFTVAAPTAEVVDLGTEFHVEVDRGGSTDVHVLKGRVEIKPAGKGVASGPVGRTVVAGQAVRVTVDDPAPVPIEFSGTHFETVRSAMVAAADRSAAEDFLNGAPIWLGNLFDDAPSTRLVEAVRTDTFKAVPKSHLSLGVERAYHAGAAFGSSDGLQYWDGGGKLQITPRVTVDLTNLGWKGMRSGAISNDACTRYEDSSGSYPGGFGGISTRRTVPIAPDAPKIEEGIGMQADAMLTFDLDEIRAAGDLGDRKLAFYSRRAGIADSNAAPRNLASVYMAVFVSTDEGEIVAAMVNGKSVGMVRQDEAWSVAEVPGKPFSGDDEPVPFAVRIPPHSRYLTLVTTVAGDSNTMDLSVWSGACLKVVP